MYRPGHIAFICISFVLIAVGLMLVRRRQPTIDELIRVCLPIALVGEAVKLFTTIEIVPVVDAVIVNGQIGFRETGAFSPYLKAEHLPFELCSLQMVFMFLALVVKDPVWRHRLHAVMYGTALIGGLLALFLSSIAPEFETAGDFLTSPRAWEFFLYHSMIIVLALSIALDRECDLRLGDLKWMVCACVILDFASLYMNSMLSVPVFQDGELRGLSYAVNFFSSYDDPLGITLATKSQYLLYFVARYVIGSVFILLVFLPFVRRGRRSDIRKEG